MILMEAFPCVYPFLRDFYHFLYLPFFGRFNFTLKLTVVIPQPQFVILHCHFKLPNKQKGLGWGGRRDLGA